MYRSPKHSEGRCFFLFFQGGGGGGPAGPGGRCGGGALGLRRLGELLPRVLQLLLQRQDGALHPLHLLIQLDDEVVQF